MSFFKFLCYELVQYLLYETKVVLWLHANHQLILCAKHTLAIFYIFFVNQHKYVHRSGADES